MKKKCLIYANCQGGALAHFLSQSKEFRTTYDVEIFENFSLMARKETLPVESLKKTDLFLYQPVLNLKHGDFRTDVVRNYLPEHCLTLSFPYIYNDALWPLFKTEEKIFNSEPILKYIEEGAHLIEIMRLFLAKKIDFQFGKRFENSIRILQEKERECTIKVLDFILETYKEERLFLTHNHPTSKLLLHCVSQILKQLGFSIDVTANHPNEARLPGCYPISSYDIEYYGLKFKESYPFMKKKEGNWRHAYLGLIMEIYFKKTGRTGLNYRLNRMVGNVLRSSTKFTDF